MKEILLAALLLAGCATPVSPAEPWPPAATPTGNRWEQVPDTGGTYRMKVKEGYVYLYWDPPKPNTMIFVPSSQAKEPYQQQEDWWDRQTREE